MRVLMVTGSYPPQPCGVGNYTQRLVHELERTGIGVGVVTTASEPPRNEPRIVQELPNWRVGTLTGVFGKIPRSGFDMVHVQYPARFYGYLPDLAYLGIAIRRALPGIPLVVTLHEFSITHVLRKLTVGALTAVADRVVMTTESELRPLLRWFPWLKAKARVIHMAPSMPVVQVGPSRREEIRSRLGVLPDERMVVYFGLLHPNKGAAKLIEAFACNSLADSRLRLLFLSYFDPARQPFHAELQSLAARLGVDRKIIWAGFLDDSTSSEFMGASDAACLPFEDGATLRRLSFMAAMSLGLPTVTTVGSVSAEEMGLTAEHAVMLPAGASSAALAAALRTLLDSPELRMRLSGGARTWASHFSWDTVVQETRALYHEVTGR